MSIRQPKSYISPLNIRARVQREQPKGLPVINLSFNESPYAPNPLVQQAIDSTTRCANAYGNPSCELLRSSLAKHNNLDAETIICGNGSEELLDIIGRCFARPGDDILISEFGYIQFPIVAHRVGANLVKAKESNFTATVDNLLTAVTENTTILFLANPNNPTGSMISTAELERLIAELPSQIILVIDLAYGEFADVEYCASVHSLAAKVNNVIVTRTFSKAFGLAGLRVGWCHAPAWMIPILNAARGMGTVNAVAQAGAMAALETMPHINNQVQQIVSERQRLSMELTHLGIKVVASHANFLMISATHDSADEPDMRAGRATHKRADTAADEFADFLFNEAGFIVNRTRESGLESFIRVSLSTPENNNRLLECIKSYLKHCA